jgi:hypothetical protein
MVCDELQSPDKRFVKILAETSTPAMFVDHFERDRRLQSSKKFFGILLIVYGTIPFYGLS